MSAKQVQPDPQGYALLYLRFLTMVRAFPNLNHKDHEPKPETFSISGQEAALIRVRIEREHRRTK
jgi:hypothetical protein